MSTDSIDRSRVFVHNIFNDIRIKWLLSNVDLGISFETAALGNSAKTVRFAATKTAATCLRVACTHWADCSVAECYKYAATAAL